MDFANSEIGRAPRSSLKPTGWIRARPRVETSGTASPREPLADRSNVPRQSPDLDDDEAELNRRANRLIDRQRRRRLGYTLSPFDSRRLRMPSPPTSLPQKQPTPSRQESVSSEDSEVVLPTRGPLPPRQQAPSRQESVSSEESSPVLLTTRVPPLRQQAPSRKMLGAPSVEDKDDSETLNEDDSETLLEDDSETLLEDDSETRSLSWPAAPNESLPPSCDDDGNGSVVMVPSPVREPRFLFGTNSYTLPLPSDQDKEGSVLKPINLCSSPLSSEHEEVLKPINLCSSPLSSEHEEEPSRLSLPTVESLNNLTPRTKRFVRDL